MYDLTGMGLGFSDLPPPVTPGGINGNLQAKSGTSFAGVPGTSYSVSEVLKLMSQAPTQSALVVEGMTGQTAEIFKVQHQTFGRLFTVANSGRVGVGANIPTGYPFEVGGIAMALRPNPLGRYYTIGADDVGGVLSLGRSDSTNVLQVIPSTLGVNVRASNRLTLDTNNGEVWIAGGSSGAPVKTYMGRRADSSASVGTGLEIWTATLQTFNALSIMAPGGGSVLSGIDVGGGIFNRATSGVPGTAGKAGEMRWDDAAHTLYIYDSTALTWRSSVFA